ncbi:VanZ family protein [Listeria booriae]|uniref:VanZ family protein n=1 Tax=Listeria booriae TaxID=1552123 RepID=A0A7X1CJH2_9LIST|nr:VanZ family protein [Listeria booriae]MBC1779920.1 VanZ family protein [Listeria booriae]
MIIYFDYWEVITSIIIIYLLCVIAFRFFFHKNWVFMIYFTIFYIYLAGVVNLTQFPIYATEAMVSQGNSIWEGISLVPFATVDVKTYILNICMTIPFGFGLPFLMKASEKKMIVMSVLFILLIESSQFIIGVMVGYMYRIFDVDDIIFNFIGCMIGYVLFILFRKVLRYFYKGEPNQTPVLFRHVL